MLTFGMFGIDGILIFGVVGDHPSILGHDGIAGMLIGLFRAGSLGIFIGVLALTLSNFSLKFGISGHLNQDVIQAQMTLSLLRITE